MPDALSVMEPNAPLTAGYLAPYCNARGTVKSRLFLPDGFSLWELEGELGAGAELEWPGRHGDEVLLVERGQMEVGSVVIGPGDVAVVESGVATTARAITDCRVLHYGPTSAEPPESGPLGRPKESPRQVHLIRRTETRVVAPAEGPGATYYADSTCPTCRVTFFEVSHTDGFVVPSHTHSEDEIIRVTEGELQLGRVKLEAGGSVAIPGDHRYGFRAPDAFRFLNYRRDASYFTGRPGTEPVLEATDAAAETAL